MQQALLKELAVDKDNKHTQRLLLGDAARLMDLSKERNERRLAKKAERERIAALSVKPPPSPPTLNFTKLQLGRIICGQRPPKASPEQADESAVVGRRTKTGRLPTPALPPVEPTPAPLVSPTEARAAASTGAAGVSHAEAEAETLGPSTAASLAPSVESVESVDVEPGRWRRVTAERYVDAYLNGGKYDPPAESLMEEVDRQRQVH